MEYFHVQLPPVAPNDPLLQQKKDILAQKALPLHFSVAANRDHELHLDVMLKSARVLNLNEIEWYFLDEDDIGPISFRNEIEALNTILTALECKDSAFKYTPSFHSLAESVVQKLGLLNGDEIMESGNACIGEKERRFLDWARREGIESKLDVAGLVHDILGSRDADASSKLCKAWGQVRDHQSLVFFDPRARANFITLQLAEKMGIKMDEVGPAYTASMATSGHEVAVTPLIGKLQLYIQGYVGHEEFFIMPLEGCDVALKCRGFTITRQFRSLLTRKLL
ncbi:hypothetical protein L7F22_011503 [Adiantum nelumboides]|nr:hypothetical protein [Adiantum nelumboides]